MDSKSSPIFKRDDDAWSMELDFLLIINGKSNMIFILIENMMNRHDATIEQTFRWTNG